MGGSAGSPDSVAPMSRPVTDLNKVMDVSGLNVIVTGGSGGIGGGIAEAFAQRGANVAILDLDAEARRLRPRNSGSSAAVTFLSSATWPIVSRYGTPWTRSSPRSALWTCS